LELLVVALIGKVQSKWFCVHFLLKEVEQEAYQSPKISPKNLLGLVTETLLIVSYKTKDEA
jgi:hypothetical protein